MTCDRANNDKFVVIQFSKMGKLMKIVTTKLFDMITSEINKPETQVLVKQKIILPIITLIYNELHPYIIAFVTTLSIILILSILTFIFFIFTYLKK